MENSGESGDDGGPLGSTAFLAGNAVPTSYIGVQDDMEGRLAFSRKNGTNCDRASNFCYTFVYYCKRDFRMFYMLISHFVLTLECRRAFSRITCLRSLPLMILIECSIFISAFLI